VLGQCAREKDRENTDAYREKRGRPQQAKGKLLPLNVSWESQRKGLRRKPE